MWELPVAPYFEKKKISNHYGEQEFALLMKDTKWLAGDKYSLSVPLDFSNSVKKLCDEWVLSTSVCGTGSFSAHTATHSTSESTHETQSFSTELRKTKKVPTNT